MPLRAGIRPIIAATAAATTGGLTYVYFTKTATVKPASTFDLAVKQRAADGTVQVQTRQFNLVSSADVDTRIRKHATSKAVPSANGLVWRHDTAFLEANSPIEDAHANTVSPRPLLPGGPSPPEHDSDLLMFGIFDGHGGPWTSRLLSKTLLPAVALELTTLNENKPESSKGALLYLTSWIPFFGTQQSIPQSKTFDADPTYVKLAIQTAFANLDSSIINSPIQILKQLAKDPSISAKDHPMAYASMLPALSGACALFALVDTARRDLFVACTGDSRAVAGYWDEDENGSGKWRVEVLSEDQTGRNPNELRRMQSEHPADEAQSVIQRGRVLGGLEPSRAFGDARYKWPKELQEKLTSTLLAGTDIPYRKPPAGLKTPPYVTCQPVITHRKLSFPQFDGPTATKSSLRFLVLATDGLWDALSSNEVVSLVGGHLKGLRGSIPKAQLLADLKTTDSASGVEGKEKREKSIEGAWAFVDDNLAAHLIRNSAGGADDAAIRKLLSIPAPLARRYRDDVTVTVLWWEGGQGRPAKAKL